jgi:hypothetical protein
MKMIKLSNYPGHGELPALFPQDKTIAVDEPSTETHHSMSDYILAI